MEKNITLDQPGCGWAEPSARRFFWSSRRSLGSRQMLTGALIVAGFLVATGAVMAQERPVRRATPAPAPAPPPTHSDVTLRRVWVNVSRPDTKEELGTLERGEVLEIQEGETVLLRMVGSQNPSGADRIRYPSTRFSVPDGQRAVAVEMVNPEVGSIILRGQRAQAGPGVLGVSWEIIESWEMDERSRNGHVSVRVLAPAAVVPPSAPAPTPLPVKGVTLFSDADYRGRSMYLTADNPNLSGSALGNDRASSIRLDTGCRATLFADTYYRGSETAIVGDSPSLDRTHVGNDRVSSIRIQCSATTVSAVLYSNEGFLGHSTQLGPGDYAELRGEVGNDDLSSLRVSPGCIVELFEDSQFRGRSALVDRDTGSLRGNAVGNDRTSSLRVRCP